ncbi:MAG: hypothetical protein PUC82_02270 [bacterium]|nr:hypothetical protein [bacterium]
MAKITEIMIREFKILELGYDFMGYSLNKGDIYLSPFNDPQS